MTKDNIETTKGDGGKDLFVSPKTVWQKEKINASRSCSFLALRGNPGRHPVLKGNMKVGGVPGQKLTV